MSVEKTYRIETIVRTENEEALRKLVRTFADSIASNRETDFVNSTLGIGMTRVVSGKSYHRRGAYFNQKGLINVNG